MPGISPCTMYLFDIYAPLSPYLHGQSRPLPYAKNKIGIFIFL
ncbi:hypothetical protein HMPREF9555_01978 [Selenomonas artemidis F0399]|uniref:Uncharacterized protein n=1 Tax=Selenomonas artemidis F0399 TaxID=749551 RepID=E7N4M9_9FIRM|nr:hypothetical protein HMPREF9555_01978 [Selenomonas artemidis F0399]